MDIGCGTEVAELAEKKIDFRRKFRKVMERFWHKSQEHKKLMKPVLINKIKKNIRLLEQYGETAHEMA